MSPHEIAVRFTDEHGYFAAETSVYRLLKALDMITSPKFIVIKAADTFHTKTTDRLVPIGVLSQRSGCSADTIRFYEKVGVLPQARRTEAGRRVYAGSDIARHLRPQSPRSRLFH